MSLKGAVGGLMGQVGRMFGAGGDEDPTEQAYGEGGGGGRVFGMGRDEDSVYRDQVWVRGGGGRVRPHLRSGRR